MERRLSNPAWWMLLRATNRTMRLIRHPGIVWSLFYLRDGGYYKGTRQHPILDSPRIDARKMPGTARGVRNAYKVERLVENIK